MGNRPTATPLRFYGAVAEQDHLEWDWVDGRLRDAGLYWVTARTPGPPHPRPVWGVWDDGALHLSLGSPTIRAALAEDPVVTVHLDSAVDVVIVEGTAAPVEDMHPALVGAYDEKYDWTYDVEAYGAFTTVTPTVVLAWRAAGPAGRDGFQEVGRWTFAEA